MVVYNVLDLSLAIMGLGVLDQVMRIPLSLEQDK